MSTINGRACVANGRNLLLDTGFNNLNLWFGNQAWTKQADKYNGLVVMQTTGDWNGLSQYVKVKTGEVYTFSVYARYTSGTGNSNIYWLLNANPEIGHARAQASPSNKLVNLSENWQRISATTTITADGYIRPRIERGNENSNVLQIAGMKLERGNVATPLTPAPVDKVFSDGKQVYGRNLIVQSGLKAGYLNQDTGDVAVTGRNFHSDNYIATNGETVFTFSSPDYVFKGNVYDDRILMYDSNKNYLGYQTITSPTQTLSKPNAAYIRFSINFTDEGGTSGHLSDWLDNHRYKLEIGNMPTPWTPAPEDVM